VDILRELHHPNMMKVIESWEPNTFEPGAIALSYSKGPTLQALLDYGGSLSTLFSRIGIAQIVDAVAYIHSHAVLHRLLFGRDF
jgi:serine/threonine protein kinase